jgi:NAD(P)-dependent dehydrogenase (short-subunit alcohol dehydrogenase family)
VNNAGIVDRTPFEQLTAREWDAVVGVNLTGAFLCSQTAAPALRASGGAIVNVASINGLIGGSAPPYDASKGGLIALTKTLARALAPAVRVNTVAPGVTDTVMQAHLTLEQRARVTSRIPLGRFAEPEEIAKSVVFLASKRAGYITGQTLIVDGGVTMW